MISPATVSKLAIDDPFGRHHGPLGLRSLRPPLAAACLVVRNSCKPVRIEIPKVRSVVAQRGRLLVAEAAFLYQLLSHLGESCTLLTQPAQGGKRPPRGLTQPASASLAASRKKPLSQPQVPPLGNSKPTASQGRSCWPGAEGWLGCLRARWLFTPLLLIFSSLDISEGHLPQCTRRLRWRPPASGRQSSSYSHSSMHQESLTVIVIDMTGGDDCNLKTSCIYQATFSAVLEVVG
jgi:hypothetical protein